MNYKLIAMDMDNTVLNHGEKIITPRTLAALKQAAQLGVEIVFASGRSFAEAEKFYAQLPEMRYYIGNTGASILDVRSGKTIHASCFDNSIRNEIRIIISRYDCYVTIHAGTKLIVDSEKLDRLDRYEISCYDGLFHETGTPVSDILDFLDRCEEEIFKVDLFFHSRDEMQEAYSLLRQKNVSLSAGTETNIEVCPAGTAKGTSLNKLCQILGIDMGQVIACGDADNDISMVRKAGLGVAMGNATPELKQTADYITADCDHDGIAEVIQTFLFQ